MNYLKKIEQFEFADLRIEEVRGTGIKISDGEIKFKS